MTRPVQQRTRGGLGLTLALLSAATFGTSGSFAASLIEAGWTPGAAVTVVAGAGSGAASGVLLSGSFPRR